MTDYWTSFAATGDPNGAGHPVWPRYAAGAEPYLDLDVEPTARAGYHAAQCDFWSWLSELSGDP
jgi:para-nitrobenzyl esterase